MKSAKLIKKVLKAAAVKGWVALDYDKSTKLYLVRFGMNKQNLNFEQLYNRAYEEPENWY